MYSFHSFNLYPILCILIYWVFFFASPTKDLSVRVITSKNYFNYHSQSCCLSVYMSCGQESNFRSLTFRAPLQPKSLEARESHFGHHSQKITCSGYQHNSIHFSEYHWWWIWNQPQWFKNNHLNFKIHCVVVILKQINNFEIS